MDFACAASEFGSIKKTTLNYDNLRQSNSESQSTYVHLQKRLDFPWRMRATKTRDTQNIPLLYTTTR